jgi:zinc transport system ATP-binding protein
MAGEKRRAASIIGDARGQQPEHGPDCEAGAGEACAHKQDSGQRSAFDPNALISARGLVVIRNGRELLFDIDIDIAPREIVTIIGPNGAGKTTLVRVLLGLEKPDRGTVQRRKDLRVGYVPQRFDVDAVIPMTVERFLMLGGDANPAEIADILREVNAPHTRTQQLSQLSGGELQRVLLARALLRRPDLLVLDEPVQGVDYAGEAELYNLIARLRDERGFGVLLVSHDLHIVMARSDRVICLNRHVCCSGVPETVAQHPAYVRLFGTQEARALGVYRHHHDHSHDIAGQPQQPETALGEKEGA